MEKLEHKKVIVMLYENNSMTPLAVIPDYAYRREFITKHFGISEIRFIEQNSRIDDIIQNFFGEDKQANCNSRVEEVRGVETYKNTINGHEKRNSVSYILAYISVDEYM